MQHTPLQLSAGRWWQELDELEETRGFPRELVVHLKGVVGTVLSGSIRPSTSDRLIGLLKQYLPGGLMVGDKLYKLVVYVPDDPEHNRQFVTLIEWYPNGRLVPLEDMP